MGPDDDEGIRPEADMHRKWLRGESESPPDEESWGGDQRFESWSDQNSPSLRVWLFLFPSATVGHSSDVKHRQKSAKKNNNKI